MSPQFHTRRRRFTPLIVLYALAAATLLGGALLLPSAHSGPTQLDAAAVASPSTAPASEPPAQAPAEPSTPPPPPAPAPTSAAPQPQAPRVEEAVEEAVEQPAPRPTPKVTPKVTPEQVPAPVQTRAPAPQPTTASRAKPRAAIPGAAPGSARAYAQSLVGDAQFSCLSPLWEHESGWNAYAVNKSSGAYGIPQALGHGHPYELGDYRAQIDWGLNYIKSRYGSPCGAWSFWQSHSWY